MAAMNDNAIYYKIKLRVPKFINWSCYHINSREIVVKVLFSKDIIVSLIYSKF